jgi:hypothetical protein
MSGSRPDGQIEFDADLFDLRRIRRGLLLSAAEFALVKRLVSQDDSYRSLPSGSIAQIFIFLFIRNHDSLPPSRLDKRGASRSSRTLRRDAVGVSMLQRGLSAPTNDVDAHGQVAWSWHPDADAKLATTLTRRTGDGGQKARRTGENAKQPFHPSRGECRDVSAEPVVPAASIFFAGGPWGRPAPGIPRALCLRGQVHQQGSDARCAAR